MIRVGHTAAALVLLLSLTGCARDSPEAEAELTWQEAKARTQAMELEIVNSIPEGKVAKVDQKTTGVLLDCSDTSVNWAGGTTVTLSAGTEMEPLLRALEAEYQDSRFNIEARTTPGGRYEVGLLSPDTAEIYLVKPGWDPDTIRIASGSDCFPWPEGEYTGGSF